MKLKTDPVRLVEIIKRENSMYYFTNDETGQLKIYTVTEKDKNEYLLPIYTQLVVI